MENKMNEYLGSQYSSDSIRNFLIYWMKPSNPWERYKNDLDCIYYNGNLNADTLFSGWTPMKLTLEILNPRRKFYKKNKYGDPLRDLKTIYEYQEELLPSRDELVILLREFLKLAEGRANYFLLPDSEMNCLRGKDGDSDWVPKFMKRLLTDDEKYRPYFKNTDEVISWIKEQRLDGCFRDGIIDEQHIDLIQPGDKIDFSWDQTRESMMEILHKYCEILSKRAVMIQSDAKV